ncbi:MAG: CoA pyrophosphatase [Frankiaceae bacterium]|nr:CoA pyrophosphatase [Frankiaceae bacterium]MBV9869910.1 CoA pyrophosphatase [Frankiaceae bacterium]
MTHVGDRPDWVERLSAGVASVDEVPFLTPPPGGVEGLRHAAVLSLFGDGPDGPDVLLMQRSADMRSHAGQPSFPGGRIDPTDDGPIGAAKREAHEETGLDPAGVEVLGLLPELWIPPSGNIVTPVVAWWRTPSEVSAVSPAEVDTVSRVPVADLVDPANRLTVRHPIGLESPAFRVADMLVWGFTAGVLDWLLTLTGWSVPWDRNIVEPVPLPGRAR